MIGSVEVGKRADLVLWNAGLLRRQAGHGASGGTIAAAPMGDPNASIPTPQPVHYRPMFGAFGKALTASSVTFVSQAALDAAWRASSASTRSCIAVKNTRGGISKQSR